MKELWFNMVFVSYKRWIIVLVVIIAAGILLYSLNRPAPRRESRPGGERTTPSPSGPLMGTESVDQSVLGRIERLSQNPESLARLGDKYFQSKKYDKAIELYEKALKLAPEDVDTYNDLGLALHYSGRSDRAIEQLRRGTEVDPSYQRVWLSLGFVLVASQRGEEAADVLRKTVEIDPDSKIAGEAQRFLGLLKSSKP
jgi:tetratricopeptide (TPR) repeat protein